MCDVCVTVRVCIATAALHNVQNYWLYVRCAAISEFGKEDWTQRHEETLLAPMEKI